jgi:hypothetical protein
MDATLVLAVIAVTPVALITFFRSNAAIVFFALCAGSVLERYVSDSAALVANSMGSRSNTDSFVHLGLLALPPLLTMFLLKKSIKPSKTIVNIFPAVAAGLTAAILAVPILPGGLQANVVNTEAWRQLSNYADFILAAGTGVALVALALTYKMPKDHHKKHK